MLKSITVFLIVLSVSSIAGATARESAFSQNRDNYFTASRSEARGQISIKYNLIWPFHSGLYVGYTNNFWWDIFKDSSPFREHNYEPEIFYELSGRYENNIARIELPFVDFYRFGIAHLSNGRDGENSRSVDYYGYFEGQLSTRGDFVIGLRWKFCRVGTVSPYNQDIKKYFGYRTGIFFGLGDGTKRIDKERICYNYHFGGESGKGRHEITAEIRIFSIDVQPFLFVTFEHGYGVGGLIDYNKKSTAFRMGIKLK